MTKDIVLGNQSDPQTLNRYAYCGGDPVNKVDPNGNDFFKWLGGVVSNAIDTAVSAVLDSCFGEPTPIAYDYGTYGTDSQGGLVPATGRGYSSSVSTSNASSPVAALAQKPWHSDYDSNKNKYLHWKDGKNNLRFNSDGKLVEHSGKVLGEPKGKELKILQRLMKAAPSFFSQPKGFVSMFFINLI